MTKGGYVYIMTNFTHTVLYTGVTARIAGRVCEHRMKLNPESFTARYNVSKLVYYRKFAKIENAIAEEKRIKAGSRLKKIELVNSINPEWNDLFKSVQYLCDN
ncbi:MAG: GIY-YIG nuclease family protein [Prevotellaceae bacterium]|nr:GIY-YIG nuclease family protein [Prevotellaceae bacterium]